MMNNLRLTDLDELVLTVRDKATRIAFYKEFDYERSSVDGASISKMSVHA